MPPSQLKRLKASLREQGIVGPQQSKKQKKQNAQNGASAEKRVHRRAALTGIREQFNPFEVKTSARGPKFEVTSSKNSGGRVTKSVKGRPGAAKGLGEENRRKTLLVEMQRRNKVGGIMDRRFGENDPSMAPEEKMMERFAQETQRRHKNSSVFDLEDDEDQIDLTHMGQSLSLDGPNLVDDFDEQELGISDSETHSGNDGVSRKRRRLSQSSNSGEEETEEGVESQPERKKTKQEVMKEVIAKSKLHKYERQTAKDDDEDLREELDKEMPELHALLRQVAPRSATTQVVDSVSMNPERAALLSGSGKAQFEKEYDFRLKQLAQDKKSQPTERSKTEDEKLADESRRLQDLEARRLRRMRGEVEEEDNIVDDISGTKGNMQDDDEEDFGFGSGIKIRDSRRELGVEDEDDFVLDDDLIASGSEVDVSDDDDASSQGDHDAGFVDESEFVEGLLTEEESKRPEFLTGANAALPEEEMPIENGTNGDLAYIYNCPESHAELLELSKTLNINDLPIVVRRIRALYHPKLKADNKPKLANFAIALVDHIHYLANQVPTAPFDVLELLIRHVHSLSKSFPVEIANAFRYHLKELNQSRALNPQSGDLILLTAIGTIFPTSDHFHQVVTPAKLCMTRYIGTKIPQNLSDTAIGLYMVTICLHYQRLSKRYVPELVGFLLNTISALAPIKMKKVVGTFPFHEPKVSSRLTDSHAGAVRQLSLSDTKSFAGTVEEERSFMLALLETSIRLLDAAADTWTGKAAFYEVFDPARKVLKHLGSNSSRPHLPESSQVLISKLIQKLNVLLSASTLARRPLELHHHKPLAIKMSIPKFEESFNPDKHYDPDRERADASKLRAEHKRERKGAMRELRKDANFIARESLREKKERDAAYEKKYKRLVAEIQGEEGHEAKAYEREREWRRKGKK